MPDHCPWLSMRSVTLKGTRTQAKATRANCPCRLEHITAATGVTQVDYVGHSQGTTIAIAALSSSERVRQSVRRAVLLAPVAFVQDTKSSVLQALAALHTERCAFPNMHLYASHRARSQKLRHAMHLCCQCLPTYAPARASACSGDHNDFTTAVRLKPEAAVVIS